jgi:hypothetical protein
MLFGVIGLLLSLGATISVYDSLRSFLRMASQRED